MICGACGESTRSAPCDGCGRDPLVDGRYRLEAVLGRGRFGVTYRATRLVDGAAVALKEMPLRAAEGPKARALLRREGETLRRVDHPRVPRLLDELFVGEGKSGAIVLVQALVEGRDLATLGAMPESEVLDVMSQVLDVLAALQALDPPVVHRDIKPANLLRDKTGAVHLVDFGAARLGDAGEYGGSTVAGTFGFMAPEQFRGEAGPATDVHGLAATALALLGGTEPGRWLDHGGQWRWNQLPPMSPGLLALLRGCLDPDPIRRPPVSGVQAEVARLRAGRPDWRPGRRALLGVAVGLPLLAFLAWSLGAAWRAELATAPPPAAVAAAACAPRLVDETEGLRDEVERFALVAASPDGRRVAMVTNRRADERGHIVATEAGAARPFLEHAATAAEVNAGWTVLRDTLLRRQSDTLRSAGLVPDPLPEAVPWCQSGTALRVDETTWSFQPFSAPCALGFGGTRSFQLCPEGATSSSRCLAAPRLDGNCRDTDYRIVNLYRSGRVLWAVAEVDNGPLVDRVLAGVVVD